MGFFDDFYNFTNYIGFTNDLLRCPTLYFMDYRYFGRITTYHKKSYNVGRQKPRNRMLRSYQGENRDFGTAQKPDVRHFESHKDPFTRKPITHKSRDAIIPADQKHKALVEYWIAKFPHAKTEDTDLQAERLHQVDNPKTGKSEWTVL